MIRATSPSQRPSAAEPAVMDGGLPDLPAASAARRSVTRRVVPAANKAHTATANRIARRYRTQYNREAGFDIQTGDFIVEVETTATMEEAVERLMGQTSRVYIALTNKDGAAEALRRLPAGRIGIMDPDGNILRESQPLGTVT